MKCGAVNRAFRPYINMTGVWLSGDKLLERFLSCAKDWLPYPRSVERNFLLKKVFFHLLWSNNLQVYNCNPSSFSPSVDSILDPTDHLTSINCSFWQNKCLHIAEMQLRAHSWSALRPRVTACDGSDCCLSSRHKPMYTFFPPLSEWRKGIELNWRQKIWESTKKFGQHTDSDS